MTTTGRKSEISACIVVCQEEQRIAACLESLGDAVDEIVVVHDGPCTDRTLDIARAYTHAVTSTDRHSGSAEFVRPHALSLCKGEWILVIDADEALSEALRQSLRRLVEDSPADAISFAWRYCDRAGNVLKPNSWSTKKFLFRRARMYTVGLPHMSPDTYGSGAILAYTVDHHHFETSVLAALRSIWRKNKRRGHDAASLLRHGPEKIATFNASIDDYRVKNARKIGIIRRHPVIAMLVTPTYSFLYWYFRKRYFLAGFTGVYDALNLSIYYYFFSWYTFKFRLRKRNRIDHLR